MLAKAGKYTDEDSRAEQRLLEWFHALRKLTAAMESHAAVSAEAITSAQLALHAAHNSSTRSRRLSAAKMAAAAMYLACKKRTLQYWSVVGWGC